ncbi:MAG: lipoyl(octanoyl) transferase LipB [Gammaproteobacteria bacterium]|nr:lipoyl(octanoyl) transferase LipB [Gammaproteobacteria bacterium]
MTSPLLTRRLGVVDYAATLQAMQDFTDRRGPGTPDELWLLQHPPVFTLGLNADSNHVLAAGDIPVVKVDRGGQVTYHGPGQLVAYLLMDCRRARIGIKDLVTRLELAVIETLSAYGIAAEGREGAPGVYVDEAKIASLGLRIRKGSSYHGLALNVAMDLEPFDRINPCGYEGLTVTQVASCGGPDDLERVSDDLEASLLARFTDS